MRITTEGESFRFNVEVYQVVLSPRNQGIKSLKSKRQMPFPLVKFPLNISAVELQFQNNKMLSRRQTVKDNLILLTALLTGRLTMTQDNDEGVYTNNVKAASIRFVPPHLRNQIPSNRMSPLSTSLPPSAPASSFAFSVVT